ncbi:MAG: hypothetical protein ABWX92_12290, partial [Mycetocola sp.]
LREENDSAVVALWELWAEALLSGVQPSPSAEVESISLEAVSGADFRYDQYTESAALDFSALSLTDQSA